MIGLIRRHAGLSSLAFVASMACNAESPVSGDGSDTGGVCIAGQSITCACTNGQTGAQACLPDGSGYSPCECTGDGSTEGVTMTGPDPTADGGSSVTTDDPNPGTTGFDSGGDTTDGSSSSDGGTGEPGVLEGWSRRRPVVVDNAVPDQLVDFQVLVHVDWDSDMQNDFDDLRFTEPDGVTLLPHWIESSNPSMNADVWVRLPSIPASGSVTPWMYYGNAAAADGSDGEATMFFVDAFDGNALDLAKWSATSAHAVTSGRLEVQTGAVYSNDAVVGLGQVLQMRIQFPCCEAAAYAPFITTSTSQGNVPLSDLLRFRPYQSVVSVQGQSMLDYFPDMNITLPNGQQWKSLGLAREFGLAHFRSYSPLDTVSFARLMPGDHYIVLGEEEGATATNQSMNDLWVDSVFVRTFAIFDPTTTVGDEEIVP